MLALTSRRSVVARTPHLGRGAPLVALRQLVQRQQRQQQQQQQGRAAMSSAAAEPGTAAAAAAASPDGSQPADPIVQWVVLRRDLWADLGWPLGPVIAQACHASSAAMFSHLQDAATQEYIAAANIDHMHKVVLEVKSEAQLVNLSARLAQEGILHKLWVEQPENYPTCLATKPYRRSAAAAHFKKLQLCKAALAGTGGKQQPS